MIGEGEPPDRRMGPRESTLGARRANGLEAMTRVTHLSRSDSPAIVRREASGPGSIIISAANQEMSGRIVRLRFRFRR
jgi:hypothetical protein